MAAKIETDELLTALYEAGLGVDARVRW